MLIRLDKNKYFTGDYSNTGGIPGAIEIPYLPPFKEQRWCQWKEFTTTVEVKKYLTKSVQATDESTGELLWEDTEKTIPVMFEIPDIDEETGEQKYELVDEEVYKTDWVFDEEGYNNYIKEQENKPDTPTTEQKISVLEEENLSLKLAITELYELMIGE